jgi:hypothetical protein
LIKVSLLERLHTHEARPAERERGVQPARLGCKPGTSADVLRDLRAAADRDTARKALTRAYDPTGIPPGCRRRVIDLALFAASFTTVEENLAVINAALSGPDAHTARMLLLPHAARIAELLGSTWDHREIGVSVGRELGTEENAAVTS